jgi:hypothetical protein
MAGGGFNPEKLDAEVKAALARRLAADGDNRAVAERDVERMEWLREQFMRVWRSEPEKT